MSCLLMKTLMSWLLQLADQINFVLHLLLLGQLNFCHLLAKTLLIKQRELKPGLRIRIRSDPNLLGRIRIIFTGSVSGSVSGSGSGSYRYFGNVKLYKQGKNILKIEISHIFRWIFQFFQLKIIIIQISFFYTCISGKRGRRRHNKKVYMVITILSEAGKKAFWNLWIWLRFNLTLRFCGTMAILNLIPLFCRWIFSRLTMLHSLIGP